jgi:hypothetical protein
MPRDHPRSFSETWPQGTRSKANTWQNSHEKIPILLTIFCYLNSGTNNEKNVILAIFFCFPHIRYTNPRNKTPPNCLQTPKYAYKFYPKTNGRAK